MDSKNFMTECQTPKQRIMQATERLFYQEGIRGVGVERIAKEAKTTKMALYRHFISKDELVACWLTSVANNYDAEWLTLETKYQGQPREMLMALASNIASPSTERNSRGCPLTNSLVELPNPSHPGRAVIASYKAKQVTRIESLCRKLRLTNPEEKAVLLHMVYEGAQIALAQGLKHYKIEESLHSFIENITDK
ncbi:TetR/AcrR family transcriptional regulator [Enterobacter cloacae]|uniref:TetR/AcrR family transcriptional regulator n=1 Tax=Enterobacter cloacae TaxID=550 RepID=UPI001140AB3F|nr:TetR/AcrR family transcriptional regulator [Enterobacter cloacae]MDW3563489.1 TetR/AcrR family transcriptional regulator [Enterobacter cloacae]WNJ09259.1 helix-turn-helix domain-containing protein [Enterobacter cloacae]